MAEVFYFRSNRRRNIDLDIRNEASNLIFSLIKTEAGRSNRPIINYAPIIFLPLLPTGKVADNQNIELSKTLFIQVRDIKLNSKKDYIKD